MSSCVNTESGLSETQKSLIKQGALEGEEWKTVHDIVCGEKPVTQSLVKRMMEQYSARQSVKTHAKLEGARVIRDFLQGVREGSDVEDLAALLELALYHDMLRRYAQAADPLVSMTMEQILKLDIAYRGARLARNKRDRTTGNNEDENTSDAIEELRIEADKRRAAGDGEENTRSGAALGLA